MKKYNAYQPYLAQNGILTFTQHHFDNTVEWTPDDEEKFIGLSFSLSPYERITAMLANLDGLQNITPEMKLHADAIRAIYKRLNNHHSVSALELADMKEADSIWREIVTIRDVIPPAIIGAKVTNGHKVRGDQLDKADFHKLAMPYFERNNYNIDKTLREKDLAPYVKKWPRAVRGWLREIRPEGKRQIGRPSKHDAIP